MSSPRILVVDDDRSIRTTLASALADDGTEIEVASSAETALALLDAAPAPDLVLCDIRMQGIDGMTLLRLLRDRAPCTKVVMMTAYHDVGTAVSAMRAGAADFLCKPFNLHELRAVVSRVMERSSAGSAESPPTPVTAAEAALPRDVALRYELGREIGRGAMARVFEARDRRHDRTVAVKVLRREIAATVGSERFLREIRITARLHHPNIVTLIDSGEVDGLPFYVMPYIEGPTLRGLMAPGQPMPIPVAAGIVRDIASALAAAHASGVVHRDVKPENVLISHRHVWVADFGVARALWDAVGAHSTSATLVVGTPAYMAPEQAAPGTPVDHRADIYALGVLAYEVLTGETPFKGDTVLAMLTAHMTEQPRPLTGLRPDVPAELASAVMRCLAKEPSARWQNAGECANYLKGFATEGSTAPVPSQTGR